MLLGVLSVTFLLGCFQGMAWLARLYQKVPALCNAEGPFGVAIPSFLLLLLFCGALFFFGRAWWYAQSRLRVWWLLIIVAGTSNALERLFYGCVYDFLKLPGFPLFNGADVVLTVSVVFLIWWEMRHRGTAPS